MKLREIAHARAGDKGDTCTVCVVPYDEKDYALLREKLTADRVKRFFKEICRGEVLRYEADGICSLNFVLHKALGGGVTRSLALDKHGKTLSSALLEMDI